MAARLPTPVRRVLRPVLGPVLRRVRPGRSPAASSSRSTGARTLDEAVEGDPRARGELEMLRAQLTEVRAELATATAPPARDDLGYLFVVTYGRSGSTLLQGVLNSIPGYLIRGENRDALDLLRRYHHKLLRERDQWTRSDPLTPTAAWYGIDGYREDLAVERMRALVVDSLLRPRPDTRVVGYKEIRWMQESWERYFTFLDELFPGMRVVVNTRDHEKVLASSWWREQEDGREKLEAIEERLDAVSAHLGERAYRLHFDDWAKDPDGLRGLFDWLGEPFDRDAVAEVMSRRHSA